MTDWKAGELALTYKRTKPDGKKVTTPDHVVDLIRKCIGDEMEVREVGVIVGVSRGNRVRSVFRCGEGGASGCVMDPKIVFSRLLLENCSAFVMAHNHPSGNSSASMSDKMLTRSFRSAGEVLDIRFLDHIVVTVDNHKSVSEA